PTGCGRRPVPVPWLDDSHDIGEVYATRAMVASQESQRGFGRPRAFSLERLIRGAAVVGIVLYILGLMVRNLYLLWFGVAEFGLVRPLYVVTGALVALPAAVLGAGYSLVGHSVTLDPRSWVLALPMSLAAVVALVFF